MQIKTTKCYSMSTIIILYHKRYQVLVSISRDAVEHLHNAVTSLRNRLAVDLIVIQLVPASWPFG